MARDEYRLHVEIPMWKVRLWMLRGLLPVVFELPPLLWPRGMVELAKAVWKPPADSG